VGLSNEGNTFLAGVYLEVREAGGAAIGTIELRFSETTLLESEWNPRGEDGKLQNVEPDYSLAPGRAARYFTPSVTIPESWEGKKQLEVTISDYIEARETNTLTVQSEDATIDYFPGHTSGGNVQIVSGALGMGNAKELTRADVTLVGSGDDGGNALGESDENNGMTPGASRTPSANGGSSSGTKRATNAAPRTGDASLAGQAAGVLALGAAAAFGAYSKRRSEIEAEDRNDMSS
jgi:hypothetical protein